MWKVGEITWTISTLTYLNQSSGLPCNLWSCAATAGDWMCPARARLWALPASGQQSDFLWAKLVQQNEDGLTKRHRRSARQFTLSPCCLSFHQAQPEGSQSRSLPLFFYNQSENSSQQLIRVFHEEWSQMLLTDCVTKATVLSIMLFYIYDPPACLCLMIKSAL